MKRELKADRLQKQTRWILVSERLPEDKTDVLAYDGSFYVCAFYKYDDGAVEWYADEIIDPTYWMPLPEPPEVIL